MDRSQASRIYSKLFDNVNGFEISMKSRKSQNITSKELTYGEVEFDSFMDILDSSKPKNGEIFYDLGCGVGKPVFMAAMHGNFSKAIGVELLKEVYDAAQEIKQAYHKIVEAADISSKTAIEFKNANLFEYDWSDGSVIYIASTCFGHDLMDSLAAEAKKLKSGSRIITLTKELEAPYLDVVYRKMLPMSWGDTTVNMYTRT